MEFLVRVADLVPAMLAYWDRDLQCRCANRALREWFGAKDRVADSLFAPGEPHVRGALAGQPQCFEVSVPGPAGVRHALVHFIPDQVDGQVQGFVAHVIDVSSLKAAESRLRASRLRTAKTARWLRRRERTLREAQRLSQVGSWEWDPRTDTVTWSDELYRIFGRDPSRPAPSYRDHAPLYLPASWARLSAAVERTLQDGSPFELELELRHPDGGTRWIDARAEAVRDASGRIAGLRGTAHDITLRRRLDEARVRMEVAESANRHKTDLLSRVSHELRTPLNAILGLGQLLQRDEGLSSRTRDWAGLIVDNGQHLLALSEDLLDLSAAEAGRLPVSEDIVDLDLVAQQACASLAASAAQAHIELQLLPVPATWRLVRGDPLRVRQVVVNLLSNAVKYGRRGSPVRVWVSASSPHWRCLHVEDLGPGMRPAQLDQLFRPFERLGAELTSVPGTGLGLALSRQLAERMGGRLEVHSTPGIGSRFTLVLPAAA